MYVIKMLQKHDPNCEMNLEEHQNRSKDDSVK